MFPCEMGRYIAGFCQEARKTGQFLRLYGPVQGIYRPPRGARSNSSPYFDQSEVSRHRPEIAVIVQQRPAIFDAPSSNQEIDGLANGHAAPAQRPEIAGRRDRDRLSCHRHNFETAQNSFNLIGSPFTIKTLQDLAKHQIAENDLLLAESNLQRHDMRHAAAIKEIDPYAAVDDDQPASRPLRLRARSPRQRYLPKTAPTSCCRRSRIINRSASSTVCFLVACPAAFWASAIRASSMSILVRTTVPQLCV
jgi:hypothetical protein